MSVFHQDVQPRTYIDLAILEARVARRPPSDQIGETSGEVGLYKIVELVQACKDEQCRRFEEAMLFQPLQYGEELAWVGTDMFSSASPNATQQASNDAHVPHCEALEECVHHI